MKQTLLALFLATSLTTPTIAAEQSPDYCDDQASWQQWQQLLADNQQDATKLFEQLRDTVIKWKLETENAGRVVL